MFHKNSHIRFDNQKPKVMYNTKKTALKSAKSLGKNGINILAFINVVFVMDIT